MSLVQILGVAAAAAVVGWLVFTWYFADDQPLFEPGDRDKRVTFKQVLANAITDLREMFDRLTNMVAVTLVSLDGIIVSTPELKTAFLGSTPGLIAFIGLNLFASVAARRATT